jgi:putative transposase
VLTEHGVPIAPRTFYAWAKRAPSKRALWDATITEILADYCEPDEAGRRKRESLYGSLKDVGAFAARRHPGGQDS